MIRHIVMFNLRQEIEDLERESLFGQIRELSRIDSVRNLTIGKVLQPRDAEYRQHMTADFEYAILVDFPDEAGLELYQKDPYHVQVGQQIRRRASAVKVTDFVTLE